MSMEQAHKIPDKPKFGPVGDITPGSDQHNLRVKVAENTLVVDRKRSDGVHVRYSEAIVGDQTASIVLTLHNEQIDQVRAGDTIEIRNAHVEMFANQYMRLVVDKWGKIKKLTPSKETVFDVNPRNLSAVEYELVSPQGEDKGGDNSRKPNPPAK